MADEPEKKEEKPMDTGDKIFCAVMVVIVICFCALLAFAAYTIVVKETTPETPMNIVIKNVYKPSSEGSLVYIEDMNCNMYATYSPSVTMKIMNVQAGATRNVMVKNYNRVYLWFEPIENHLFASLSRSI
jgi:flagellar basal body-associated protein FliL